MRDNCSKFQVTYPPRDQITFDGGKNSKYQRALIPENQSPDCLNVVSDGDAVGTRGGTTKINTSSVGSLSCDGLFTRHHTSGSESMVAWFGGSFFQISGTTFITVPSGQSLWTAGSRVYSAEYENYLFMGNGGSIPMKWNGAELTRHGVYPPQSSPTYSTLGSSAGTAVSTGTWYYKVSYVNSASVEGNVSSASVAVSGACQTVRLDVPTAAASFGVNSRKIYRASSTVASYQLIATINDNSTTTYDDIFTQTVGAVPPTDNGVPPLYNAIVEHQGRLFANDTANPNYVWFSGVGEPYTWSLLDFQYVGDATSDLVRALAIQDNSLQILCQKSIHSIYMPSQDDADWVQLRTKSPFGTKSHGAVFSFKNRIGFAALENDQFMGFASLQGTEVNPNQALLTTGSMISNLISDPIEDDMLLVPESYANRIASVVFEGKVYIALPYGAGQTTNNRIYVLDFNREAMSRSDTGDLAWFPWSYSALSPGPMTIYNNTVYFGSDAATGFVYKINQDTYSDDSAAINSYYTTKEFSGMPSDINNHKDFRSIDFLYALLGSYNMSIGFRNDSSSGSYSASNVDLTPGGSLWGTMRWNIDEWSAGYQEKEDRQYLSSSRGKRIQFKFSNQNTAGQGFKIIHMRYSYLKKGQR